MLKKERRCVDVVFHAIDSVDVVDDIIGGEQSNTIR